MSTDQTISDDIRSKDLIWEKIDEVIKSSTICNQLFSQISKHNKSWAIVGGSVRVWVTKMDNITNDLDLVINANSDVIDNIISTLVRNNKSITIQITKLGGYRIISNEIHIDIWPAFKSVGIVNGNYSDENLYRAVSKSAALSIDSIVFTSKGTIYERGFFKTLKTGVLSLNHSDIDQSKSIANKAIRLCNEYDLIPDFALQSLIMSETGLAHSDLLQKIKAYNKLFVRTGSRLVDEFENLNQPHKR